MAIVHRNNSYYVVTRDPESGKQKWQSCGQGLEGKKQAHELHDTLKDRGQIRTYTPNPPAMEAPTFTTLANEYMKARRADMPKVSLANLFQKLKSVILPEIGHLPATRITGRRLDQYIAKRATQPVYKRIGKKDHQRMEVATDRHGQPRTVKMTTIHRELTDIQAILNWAADPVRGYIAANPVAGYRKPRRDDEIIMPPTAAEIRSIMAHMPDHARRAVILSYYTGVRPGRELFGIKWDDTDLDKQTILIRSARKGGPAHRRVPIPDELMPAMKKWRTADRQEARDLADQGRIQPPEIIRYKNRPVTSIKKALNTAKAAAGITRRLRLYDLRHAYATDLLDTGADIASVAYLMGHSRPDTTARIYRHIAAQRLHEIVNKRPHLTISLDEKETEKQK